MRETCLTRRSQAADAECEHSTKLVWVAASFMRSFGGKRLLQQAWGFLHEMRRLKLADDEMRHIGTRQHRDRHPRTEVFASAIAARPRPISELRWPYNGPIDPTSLDQSFLGLMVGNFVAQRERRDEAQDESHSGSALADADERLVNQATQAGGLHRRKDVLDAVNDRVVVRERRSHAERRHDRVVTRHRLSNRLGIADVASDHA